MKAAAGKHQPSLKPSFFFLFSNGRKVSNLKGIQRSINFELHGCYCCIFALSPPLRLWCKGGNLRLYRWKFLSKLSPRCFIFTSAWIPNSLIGRISPSRHLRLPTVDTMNVSLECCWRQLWAWQWHKTPRRPDSSRHRAIWAAHTLTGLESRGDDE